MVGQPQRATVKRRAAPAVCSHLLSSQRRGPHRSAPRSQPAVATREGAANQAAGCGESRPARRSGWAAARNWAPAPGQALLLSGASPEAPLGPSRGPRKAPCSPNCPPGDRRASCGGAVNCGRCGSLGPSEVVAVNERGQAMASRASRRNLHSWGGRAARCCAPSRAALTCGATGPNSAALLLAGGHRAPARCCAGLTAACWQWPPPRCHSRGAAGPRQTPPAMELLPPPPPRQSDEGAPNHRRMGHVRACGTAITGAARGMPACAEGMVPVAPAGRSRWHPCGARGGLGRCQRQNACFDQRHSSQDTTNRHPQSDTARRAGATCSLVCCPEPPLARVGCTPPHMGHSPIGGASCTLPPPLIQRPCPAAFLLPHSQTLPLQRLWQCPSSPAQRCACHCHSCRLAGRAAASFSRSSADSCRVA